AAAYSALGGGFRRAIKPEVLLPGGRVLYRRPSDAGGMVLTDSRVMSRPLGAQCASPAGTVGDLGAAAFWQGSSVSAALGSRACHRIHDWLTVMRQDGAEGIETDFDAVLLK